MSMWDVIGSQKSCYRAGVMCSLEGQARRIFRQGVLWWGGGVSQALYSADAVFSIALSPFKKSLVPPLHEDTENAM